MLTVLAALSFLTVNICGSPLSDPVLVSHEVSPNYHVKPFTVDLAEKFEVMIERVKASRLPKKPLYPGSEGLGIGLDHLVDLKTEWTTSYDWKKEQDTYKHYTVNIEGIDLHFIHEKSAAKDAIPIILQHGWPGSILEFIPVITSLTQQVTLASGKNVSFHVVVPSLPGFAFYSAPPSNWTIEDTALTYAIHGTDWGSATGFAMYEQFNVTVRAAHFSFLPFFAPTPEEVAAANITLSDVGKVTTERYVDFLTLLQLVCNIWLFIEKQTDTNQGYALYDNPLGQLSWMGQFFALDTSPPGPPSLLDNTAVLDAVSLYYLTDSFISSIYMYAQNPNGFTSTYRRAQTDAPLLFSNFQYNFEYWPLEYVQRIGNVVYFKDHDLGCHFAGLDNPPALIDGIRQIWDHWAV